MSWFDNGVAACGREALVLYSVLRPSAEWSGQATYVVTMQYEARYLPAVHREPGFVGAVELLHVAG